MGEFKIFQGVPSSVSRIISQGQVCQPIKDFFMGLIFQFFSQMTKHHQTEKNHLSSFITKLLKLLQDSRYKSIIAWTADGHSITIDSHNELLETSLSKYFNHTKISSFVRQLNLYGFKKVSERGFRMMYMHQYFIRDKGNLHMLIKRKRKNRIQFQKVAKLEQEGQNSVLQKQKDKIKGLQDIYSRIRSENRRIKEQTDAINFNNQNLEQIRKSAFFAQLKRESTQSWARTEQNSVEPSQHKSVSNERQQSGGAQNIDQDEYEERNEYYGEQQDEQNQNQNNNEMGMFREDYEELSCEKMGPGNEEEASFWRKDRMKCGNEN